MVGLTAKRPAARRNRSNEGDAPNPVPLIPLRHSSTSIQKRRAFFWVRHEHIGGLGAFAARSAVAKGEHLFVGRMEGPDLGAGRY